LNDHDQRNVAHGLPTGHRTEFKPAEAVDCTGTIGPWEMTMIRKLKSGEYRLYSRKKNPATGKRRNLGTFRTRDAAEKHEREVQYFKRAGH
jgi:hypothetical protein